MTMAVTASISTATNTWFDRPVSGSAICRAASTLLQQGLFVADLVYFEGENAPVEAPTLPACSIPLRPPGMTGTPSMRGHPHPRARIDHRPHCLAGWDELAACWCCADDTRVSLNLMRKIRELVRQGMCSGGRPGRKALPAWSAIPESDSEVRRIVDELWAPIRRAQRSSSRKVGQWPRGHIIWGQRVERRGC